MVGDSPGGSSRDGMSKPAVFLDRDGVLVRGEIRDGKLYAPRRLEDFRLLPGAAESVRALRDHGFLTIVVTNQPDIGNGFVAAETVEAMHAIMRRKLPLDAIEVCPHRQTDGCACRKPKAGLLLAAAERFSVDFSASFMVGDRCSDIVAGRSVGCYTLFVDRGYDRCTDVRPDAVVRSVRQAVGHILRRAAPRGEQSIA
jgi:D-glycero-D-manno-heptose 1,7-bisphosphate phosphatase